ncbi:Transposase, Mutator family [Microbispora rosea]|uniref:Transposase, Mutator family n=1 Tax=Microbispora rosea TaxID=58117 RepID=A0A1N7HJA4_9ACTN|nr:hypothetical protein Mro03_57620 [Microbispora rosea subsp. rosea]SIS24863.1 Transposase, Mutator family [Microbispora rosea]
MSAEADSLCGASYGERSSERTNQRNGYRTRAWDTRAGTVELAIPKLRQGSALADGAVSEAERQELDLVATLLHLPLGAIEDALTDAAGTPGAPTTRFALAAGPDPVGRHG